MLIVDVLHAIVDDGQERLRSECLRSGDMARLDGGMRGYEECRAQEPAIIKDIISRAGILRVEARDKGEMALSYARGYEEAAIQVGSILSCALNYLNLPEICRYGPEHVLLYVNIVGYEPARFAGRQNNR